MPATPSRRYVRTRSISVRAYARDDGLWDLEAELTDVKEMDFALAVGIRKAGDPVHAMQQRLGGTQRCTHLTELAKYYPRWYTGSRTQEITEGQGK